jgi:SpoVK/Ycf46/Vps4 family AAA+-type ATPase
MYTTLQVADKMPGASGAEMKAACTEAGMFALRERRVHVTQEDFEMACAQVCPAAVTAQRDIGTVCYPLPQLFSPLMPLFSLQCSVVTVQCFWHSKTR